MISEEAHKVTEELFDSLKKRYQNNLETKMRNSGLVFDYAHLLYYKCHWINLKCGVSYIDSPDWIKNKSTRNRINKKES